MPDLKHSGDQASSLAEKAQLLNDIRLSRWWGLQPKQQRIESQQPQLWHTTDLSNRGVQCFNQTKFRQSS